MKTGTFLVLAAAAGWAASNYFRDVARVHVIFETKDPEIEQSNFAVEMFDAVHDMLTTDANVAAIREKLFL